MAVTSPRFDWAREFWHFQLSAALRSLLLARPHNRKCCCCSCWFSVNFSFWHFHLSIITCWPDRCPRLRGCNIRTDDW